jgi:hypothetical protein
MSSWSSSDGTAPPQPARPVLRRAAANPRSLLLRVTVCPPPASSCAAARPRGSRVTVPTPQTCTAGHPGGLTPSRWQWRYYMCRVWWWSTSMTRVRRQGKASGSSGRLG